MTPTIVAAQDLKKKHLADLESMEGAVVAYTCIMSRTPLIMLKSVSNIAGVRDKSQWDIPKALSNLANSCIDILDSNFKKNIQLY